MEDGFIKFGFFKELKSGKFSLTKFNKNLIKNSDEKYFFIHLSANEQDSFRVGKMFPPELMEKSLEELAIEYVLKEDARGEEFPSAKQEGVYELANVGEVKLVLDSLRLLGKSKYYPLEAGSMDLSSLERLFGKGNVSDGYDVVHPLCLVNIKNTKF